MPPLFVVVVHPGERDSLPNQVQLCQVFNQFIYHLRTRYISLLFHFHFHPENKISFHSFTFTFITFTSLLFPSGWRGSLSSSFAHIPSSKQVVHLGFRGKEILWKGEAIWYIAIVTEYRIHSSVFVIPKKVDITSYFLFRVFWFIGLCVFSLSLKIPPSRHFKL